MAYLYFMEDKRTEKEYKITMTELIDRVANALNMDKKEVKAKLNKGKMFQTPNANYFRVNSVTYKNTINGDE